MSKEKNTKLREKKIYCEDCMFYTGNKRDRKVLFILSCISWVILGLIQFGMGFSVGVILGITFIMAFFEMVLIIAEYESSIGCRKGIELEMVEHYPTHKDKYTKVLDEYDLNENNNCNYFKRVFSK